MKAALAAAVVALLLGVGCGADQDPGVTPGTTGGAPRTTSNTLPPCPPGGPDASTPAGCLDDDGAVVQP